VQTGVVMVIYLEEAVERKRKELGGTLTLSSLRDAVTEGALLRLRPKVMTVSTVVAGLLPIMWSTQVGAEVMKPLATPVLGGMVSSLLHVLIVTPVIFFWIRQRRLGLHDERLEMHAAPRPRSRPPLTVIVIALMALIAAGFLVSKSLRRGTSPGESAGGGVVQTVRAGDMEIVLRAPADVLRTGNNSFSIEFRSVQSSALVDPGTVRASANMTMPGMVMTSNIQLRPSGTAGRYMGTAEFGMAGSWRFALEWDGPTGKGSTTFEGKVQ